MDKVRLLTPPNDTARDAERWYEFAVYLSRCSELSVTPLTTSTAKEFQLQLAGAEIVYSPPEVILWLIREFRFSPLIQPEQVYEEVFLVSGPAASANFLHRTSENDISRKTE